MKRPVCVAALSALLVLAACKGQESVDTQDQSLASGNGADPMASHDPSPGQPGERDDTSRPVMRAQVVLERLGFAPGVITGAMTPATRSAIRGLQESMNLPQTGELDDATHAVIDRQGQIAATRQVVIPADFAAGPFAPLPKDSSQQAKLPAMGYASLEEKLAERFHTTPEVLRALNQAQPLPEGVQNAAPAPLPPVAYAAGQTIRVPNVGADTIDPTLVKNPVWLTTLASLGVGTGSIAAKRIIVSKRQGTLKVYDGESKLVAQFPVTTGSEHDPLPMGRWKINGVDRNPKFHYNPKLFWDVSDSKPDAMLPAGPNNPVGVVWIDLSKPHYGIHGTPEPAAIGRSESHGCVRLTNWDAARLANMVSPATQVDFVS